MSTRAITGDVRAASTDELFSVEVDLRNEIKRRAQVILKELGHEWFKLNSLDVTEQIRNKVDVIVIEANIENNFQKSIVKLEMPYKQFEMLLRMKGEA